jgi:hypothetical protein
VRAESRLAFIGLGAAFVVALSFLGVGGFLVYTGHDWAGTTIVITAGGGLVASFIYGRRKESEADTEVRAVADTRGSDEAGAAT